MKSMLKSLMSVAVAALAFTSCSNDATEEVIPNGGSGSKTLVVNASIDQTRTVMADNHIDLNWTESDEILFYIGKDGAKNKINPATDSKISGVTYNEGDMVYAIYSIGTDTYSKGATSAQINIVNTQTQSAANVFAGENLPMTAKGAIENGSVSLNFQPFGCVLVFNVYGSAYNPNEKIKSIKFETSVGCSGYANCDLTAESLGYKAYANNKSAEVTLTTPATIGAAKPSDTKVGENQVYMVLAPVNYTAATITVNTTLDSEKIFNTYTFTTANGIDCSTNTARVVNLNLAKAAVVPSIDVPVVPQQVSDGGDLVIENIVFKNLAVKDAEVGVYSNEELTESENVAWLTIVNANLASGVLNCEVAANTTTASRTAYIGIKCGDVQVAIPVTQVVQGASTDKYYEKVTSDLEDWTGDYLIVYEGADGAKALDGSLSKIDAVNDYINVTITEQGILSNKTTNASLVKISKVEGGYVLQATQGQYIYSPSDANQLKETTDKNTAANSPNSISIDGSSAKIESKGSVLRFNSTSNQMRFRYYKSGSYANQKAIQLYKLQK